MKKQYFFLLSSLCFIFYFTYPLFSEIPPPPDPARLVNDFANLLTIEEQEQLELELCKFHHETSNQIVILTISSLEGYEPAAYAHQVGELWEVGQKGFNNGIVILIKPKHNNADKGQAYIALGYGLEAAIPDAVAKQIIENKMIPEFKNEAYFTGISRATNSLMALASKEMSAYGYNGKKSGKFMSLLYFFLPFAFLLAYLLLLIWGKNGSVSITSTGTDYSSFNGWSSPGHTSNSFGGGFSGFGGGSFGGGGAGGSW